MTLNRFLTPFFLLAPPYRTLTPLDNPDRLHARGLSLRGCALVWFLGNGESSSQTALAESRAAGLALIVVLPPKARTRAAGDFLDLLDLCRPQSILPYHPSPDPEELARLLARPPADFAGEVSDYLSWRGFSFDSDTRRLVRKTLELSGELRTIGGLARALYLSRRALGRRFMSNGLPVPSHWLQFGRLLRVAIQLQNTGDSLFAVAHAHGYSDGFALSNQMYRLTGARPSTVRERLGWEWFVESWLETETAEGGLALPPRVPTWRPHNLPEQGSPASVTPALPAQRVAKHNSS